MMGRRSCSSGKTVFLARRLCLKSKHRERLRSILVGLVRARPRCTFSQLQGVVKLEFFLGFFDAAKPAVCSSQCEMDFAALGIQSGCSLQIAHRIGGFL